MPSLYMESLTTAQKELFDWLVDYIHRNQYPPSIRQMMKAMKLKSPAPIQSRLKNLRAKGYIDWAEGKARTIRILPEVMPGFMLSAPAPSVPILGAIAAGGLVEPFSDEVEQFDIPSQLLRPPSFALRVTGDSMIEALIAEGDVAIMRPVAEPDRLKNGEIVAARVEGHGNTLKYFHRKGSQVTLKPANSKYQPIKVPAAEVEVQGRLVGVWRGYTSG